MLLNFIFFVRLKKPKKVLCSIIGNLKRFFIPFVVNIRLCFDVKYLKINIMTRIVKIMLIAVAVISFSSCNDEMESTYVGFEDGIETPDTNIVYDGLDYVAKFDTTVNELFTVEQTLRGNILTCEDEQIIQGDTFSYDLYLNVKFSAEPQQVYVLKKEYLSSVALTSSSVADEVVKDSTANDFTLTSVERDYEFVFNEGEKGVA